MNQLGNINFQLYNSSDDTDDYVDNISYDNPSNNKENEIICEYNNNVDFQKS